MESINTEWAIVPTHIFDPRNFVMLDDGIKRRVVYASGDVYAVRYANVDGITASEIITPAYFCPTMAELERIWPRWMQLWVTAERAQQMRDLLPVCLRIGCLVQYEVIYRDDLQHKTGPLRNFDKQLHMAQGVSLPGENLIGEMLRGMDEEDKCYCKFEWREAAWLPNGLLPRPTLSASLNTR